MHGNKKSDGRSGKSTTRTSKEKMKPKAKYVFTKRAYGIVIGVMVAALAGVMIFFLTREGPEPVYIERPQQQQTGGRGTVVTQDNVHDIIEQMNRPVEDGYYTVSMNVRWEFPNGSSPSTNARVRNRERNTRTVYFDVNLDEDGRLVYSSPYIPLGAMIEKFALDENLPAGEYPATVTYFLVDDDHNVITDVSAGVTIIVLN